jgi:hypothetical protein
MSTANLAGRSGCVFHSKSPDLICGTFRALGLVVVLVVPVVFMFLMFFVVSPIRLLVTISTSVPIRWIFVRMTISIWLLFEAGLKCEHTK